MELVPFLAAIDWSVLTTGLTAAFEDGVEAGLPIAGVIFAALLAYRFIKRVIKGAG